MKNPDVADRPARILIVDDQPANRSLLKVILAGEGFVILTAASGEEALATVARDPPDLILLDIMMPGMDGHEVAAKLKGARATESIPVIMMSALDVQSASGGAEEFLTKPVGRAELCERVRKVLRVNTFGD